MVERDRRFCVCVCVGGVLCIYFPNCYANSDALMEYPAFQLFITRNNFKSQLTFQFKPFLTNY